MSQNAELIDRFGRVHTDLRLSITDRCNIRCKYCMPHEDILFLPRQQLLSYEEIQRFVRIVASLGVRSVRLTGGEPLVRTDVPQLVSLLSQIEGIEDIALTTNGILLVDQAHDLRQAGLRRVNISLDTLQEEKFFQLSRRRGLDRVLRGIAAAQAANFHQIRLNAIAMRNVTEDEIIPLVNFARERQLELRFIEFMPLDADEKWRPEGVLSGATIRQQIEAEFGPLTAKYRRDESQPAVDHLLADGITTIGFINPVTEPFCGTCNRLRLTADGKVRNCLFSVEESDVRSLLRSGATDAAIARKVRDSIAGKKPGHGIDAPDFLRPSRAMYQIGG